MLLAIHDGTVSRNDHSTTASKSRPMPTTTRLPIADCLVARSPGPLIVAKATVTPVRVIYFRAFNQNIPRPQRLSYMLFGDGKEAHVDHYIAADRAALFAAASPLPRTVMTYDADHSLAVPQAAADRRAWLLEHLFGT